MKKTPFIIAIITAWCLLAYCSTPQNKNITTLIVGTWKLEGMNCGKNGADCAPCDDQFCGVSFRLLENGDIQIKGKKTGTYRVEGAHFTIIDGDNTSTINILHIDEKTIITGEQGGNITRKLVRVE
jgi:hypothetical protein